MSEFFFERLGLLLPQLLASLTVEEKKDADKEFEAVTKLDCDEASKTLSDVDFRRAASDAIRKVRERRRRKPDEKGPEMMVYA